MAKTGKSGNGEDLTIKILKEIRDEIRSTNQRLDQTRTELGARIEDTNKGLDQTRTELGTRIAETNKRLTESEIRLATAILGLRDSIGEVRDLLRDQLDLRGRVERIEQHLRLDPT